MRPVQQAIQVVSQSTQRVLELPRYKFQLVHRVEKEPRRGLTVLFPRVESSPLRRSQELLERLAGERLQGDEKAWLPGSHQLRRRFAHFHRLARPGLRE